MANPLILHPHHRVSLINKDMLLGGLVGALTGAAFFAPVGAAALVAIGIGAAIGGKLGRQRLERENAEGKPVTSPSWMNKEMLIGALAGALMGSGLGTVAMMEVMGPEVVSAITNSAVTQQMFGPIFAGIGTLAASAAGSILGGAYLGGKAGYRRMEHEYRMALEQERGNALTHEAERNIGIDPERTPEQSPDIRKYTQAERERDMARSAQQVADAPVHR